MSIPIDFSALDGVKRAGVTYQPPGTGGVGQLYLIVFTGIFGAFALPFLGIVQGLVGRAGGDTEAPPFVVVRILLILTIVLPSVWIVVVIARGFRAGTDLSAKLPAFAAANGLEHTLRGDSALLPGAIFRSNFASWVFHRLTRVEGRHLEIGNVATRIPAGRTTTTDTWGYLAIRLDRPLPHILLEAVASDRNTQGALPVSVDPAQRLSLEGDFDRHFTLYCPADYETDALYILAPDLMALLIDESGGWHVEIIDDWLFVYSPDDFVTGASVETYRRLFRIAELVGQKAVRQTRAYRDDTAAAPAVIVEPDGVHKPAGMPAVAPAGKRMVPGTSQYNRLFLISCGVLGGICVLFTVGVFVAMAVVFAVYGPPLE